MSDMFFQQFDAIKQIDCHILKFLKTTSHVRTSDYIHQGLERKDGGSLIREDDTRQRRLLYS